MHYDDLLVRQLHAGIVLGDTGVVPVGDLAQKNVSEHVAAESEVAHAGNIE